MYLMRLDQSFAEELCLPAFLVGWETKQPLRLPMRGAGDKSSGVTPAWSFTPPEGWRPTRADRALWRTGWTGKLEDAPAFARHPTSLFELAHAIEGYACGSTTFVGILLPLRQVEAFAPLMPIFDAMAQDPDFDAILQLAPELRGLFGTGAHEYTPAELGRLHERVTQVLDLPRFERGVEAAVLLDPCDPERVFGGLRVLEAHIQGDRVVFGDGRPLDAEHLRRLGQFCGPFGLRDPRSFLLWTNCD